MEVMKLYTKVYFFPGHSVQRFMVPKNVLQVTASYDEILISSCYLDVSRLIILSTDAALYPLLFLHRQQRIKMVESVQVITEKKDSTQ